jgi:hypothetical protein
MFKADMGNLRLKWCDRNLALAAHAIPLLEKIQEDRAPQANGIPGLAVLRFEISSLLITS